MRPLPAQLASKQVVLADGGMGTLVQQAGLSGIHEVPDLLNLTHAAQICDLQRRYVEAGSDVIATNTFSANRLKLAGTGHDVAEVYMAATQIARDAGAPFVAGDIGPTGALLEPLGQMGFDDACDIFAEQARSAADAGCDLIFLETFADLLEAKAALLACLDVTNLPVCVTMTFGEDGRTFTGTSPAIAAATLSALGATAVGINCSLGPVETTPLVAQMAPYARCPLMVQPNAGLPAIAKDGSTVYDVGPDEFAGAMRGILDAGTRIVGGCCGTTPAHIAALRALIDSGSWQRESRARPSFVVCSGQELVELEQDGHDIAIVGERINPTGKARLKEALVSGDYDVAVSEAVAQARAGARILDVNVGVPGIDEALVLRDVTRRLQACVTTPLQIDSSSPDALEAACRSYCGRPLVNSVNGKATSLETVLPIAARYGATIIGLTLDENGIPPTAAGRLAIARRIVEAAEDAGIPRCDVAIDCLVMAAATNQAEVSQILEAVRLCKAELGVRTVLGVSNVSFGLPHREVLNAGFLSAALACGLDLPIINPLEPRYRDAVRAHEVMSGQDAGCVAYVETYANMADDGNTAHAGTSDGASTIDMQQDAGNDRDALFDAVLTGRASAAAQATRSLVTTMDVEGIAGTVLAPALDEVGARYDSGAYFLPQLMASAEAAKAAFDVLSETGIVTREAAPHKRNTLPIVIATVEGDIHDIGKNIAGMLLENYGFSVIDLGRDVAPQVVVDAAMKAGALLVGLSALMTTTVGAMEKTIELLREQAPDIKVMVGGAVITAEYADRMGADYYVADAAASVRVAQELLE